MSSALYIVHVILDNRYYVKRVQYIALDTLCLPIMGVVITMVIQMLYGEIKLSPTVHPNSKRVSYRFVRYRPVPAHLQSSCVDDMKHTKNRAEKISVG